MRVKAKNKGPRNRPQFAPYTVGERYDFNPFIDPYPLWYATPKLKLRNQRKTIAKSVFIQSPSLEDDTTEEQP